MQTAKFAPAVARIPSGVILPNASENAVHAYAQKRVHHMIWGLGRREVYTICTPSDMGFREKGGQGLRRDGGDQIPPWPRILN